MLMGKDLVVRKEAENTGDEGILIKCGVPEKQQRAV